MIYSLNTFWLRNFNNQKLFGGYDYLPSNQFTIGEGWCLKKGWEFKKKIPKKLKLTLKNFSIKYLGTSFNRCRECWCDSVPIFLRNVKPTLRIFLQVLKQVQQEIICSTIHFLARCLIISALRSAGLWLLKMQEKELWWKHKNMSSITG